MWTVKNSVIWLMNFDLYESFFKTCVSGKCLGACIPEGTPRRVILAFGRAKHAGLTASHSYLCGKYVKTMMGHIMLWFALRLAALESLQWSIKDVARQK